MPMLLAVAMGLLDYIRERARRRSWMRHDDHKHNGRNGDNGNGHFSERGNEDARAEQLREEVRRYEQDLRELADA
jgi:hypothetical protein